MIGKPRIRLVSAADCLWICHGAGINGHGFSPAAAYSSWWKRYAWAYSAEVRL